MSGRGPARVAATAALVLLVALGVRAVYLVQLARTPWADERELISDAAYYDMRAREIATGGLLGDAPAFLSPAYCLVLGAVYAATRPDPMAARVFQALLGALSCALLYLAARRYFDERTALFAAALFAFYGPHVFYGGLLLPATLVVFLHVLLLWLVARPPTVAVALAAGAIAGFATLAKSNAILLVPAIATVWWLLYREQPAKRRLGALLAAAAALTILPVTAANYAISGRFLLVATTSGSNLLKGNGPTANGTHAFLPLGTEFTGLRAHLDHAVDPAAAVAQSHAHAASARRYMLAHPLRTLRLFGTKLLLMLNRRELGIRDSYDFVRTRIPLLSLPLLSFWAVVPLGLTGLVFAWSERRRQAVLFAVLAVQAISFVLVFVLARYRLPAVACLAPFAAYQILWTAERARATEWRKIAGAAAVLALFLALAFLPLSEFPRERGFADQYKFLADREQAGGDDAAAVEHYQAALASDWQDGRRAMPLRWECMLRLVQALVALDRSEDARAVADRLEQEMAAVRHGSRPPGGEE